MVVMLVMACLPHALGVHTDMGRGLKVGRLKGRHAPAERPGRTS
jgi:hypothetical protein